MRFVGRQLHRVICSINLREMLAANTFLQDQCRIVRLLGKAEWARFMRRTISGRLAGRAERNLVVAQTANLRILAKSAEMR